MAHESAHAWLNEHVGPEASKQREDDADILGGVGGSTLSSRPSPMGRANLGTHPLVLGNSPQFSRVWLSGAEGPNLFTPLLG
jgi:hypothetical protein